jgi:hypothetical protein
MRFFGEIGFGVPVNKGGGVWEDSITERQYYGDVRQNAQSMVLGDSILTEKSFNTTISIVADGFALENFTAIKYVKWAGSLWTVNSVRSDQRPRLVLILGEVYNGPTAPAPDPA